MRSGGALVAMTFLVCGMLLSGCAEGRGRGQAAPAETTEEAPAAEGQGTVRGTVLDELSLPVENATVAAADLTDQTGADGTFVLEPLPPGPIVVVASKDGYFDGSRGVVVEVGRPLDIVLELDLRPLASPYLRTSQQNGFLSCSLMGTVATGDNSCPQALRDGQKDRFEAPFDLLGLESVMWDVRWNSTFPAGTGEFVGRLVLQLTDADGRAYESKVDYGRILIVLPAAGIMDEITEEPAVYYRVNAAPFGCPLCGGEPVGGAAYQQPFSTTVTFSYFQQLDDEGNLVPDDTQTPD